MPTTRPIRLLLVLVAALALVAGACGSDDDPAMEAGGQGGGGGGEKPTITVGSFDFPESRLLAQIYGGALEARGYTVEYKLGLGSREIVAPALAEGEIDLVPEYVGNLLSFYNADAIKAGDDLDTVVENLRQEAEAKQLTVLEPSPATDEDAIAVTRELADRLGLESIADLKAEATNLVFGGPPECPERDTCLKGLQEVYGLEFEEFKALDVGGPITIGALEKGDVDVARVFSSDPAIKSKDLVVLDDPESVQPKGNVVPVVRTEVVDDELESILNEVSEKLTTEALIDMNTEIGVEKADIDAVAQAWLQEHGFTG